MLIDSNILIYALSIRSPKRQMAQEFLQNQRNQLVIAHQNYLETIRILTHNKFPSPFNPREALKAVNSITKQAKVIFPQQNTLAIFKILVQTYKTKGLEVFDSYLIATALSNGVTHIATDNQKHFAKYSEISVLNPFN